MAQRNPPEPTRPMPPGRRYRPVAAPSAASAPRAISAGYIPWWMLLVLVLGFGLMFAVSWALVLASRASAPPQPSPTAVIVVVFPTAAPPGSQSTVAVTPLPQPTPTVPPAPAGPINLGNSVRVVGTGGDGLRLRVGPSLQEDANFLALENEVLVVQSGPTIADGFTWWFLVDPTNDTRNGWAAENYLEVVQDAP
jgi:hypothetical protein